MAARNALMEALRSTVNHCQVEAEVGRTETLQGALLTMAGYLEGLDDEAVELIEDLLEATQ